MLGETRMKPAGRATVDRQPGPARRPEVPQASPAKPPNLFIVGAHKTGTTSLHRYLGAHPAIFMCPIKEPMHFCTDLHRFAELGFPFALDYKEVLQGKEPPSDGSIVVGWEDYLALFREVRQEKVVGESSVNYLYSRTAAGEIKKRIPGAKIVVVLRQPIDRAYSHYLNDRRARLRWGTFHEELHRPHGPRDWWTWGAKYPLIEFGMYHDKVKRYLDLFPREQVKILLYDDLVRDPEAFLRELFVFLNVDPDFRPPNLSRRFNASERLPRSQRLDAFVDSLESWGAMRLLKGFSVRRRLSRLYYTGRMPKMTEEDREFLRQTFAPDVERLARLIDRDLSAWLK